jgi:hypothetical protein
MSTVTETPIQLSYFVADIATALTTYNRLRWHRSRTGQYGVYEAATGTAATSAAVTGTRLTPHQISGLTLKFRVDGTTDETITFADPDPVTTAQAVIEINNATALVTASDAGGYLVLTSATTGSDSSVEIQDGTANAFLGFVEGQGAVGLDVDTTLVAGTHEYFWIDNNSSTDFWYRAEFFHTGTAKTTGLGVPFIGDQAVTVSKSRTLVAYIRLADLSGNPVPGRRITLSNVFVPNLVADQTYNWGVFRGHSTVCTDRNGYAELRLLRGMVLDLSVDGSNFVRRITIPLTGDSVDLLDAALVTADEFGIQEQNVDFAVRTS